MKKIAACLLAMCLLLSGCSYFAGGSYASVTPHSQPANQGEVKPIPVYGYEDIVAALAGVVQTSEENAILSMQYGSREENETELEKAVQNVRENDPFAAYAVERIVYAFDDTASPNTVNVQISYLPERVRTDQIPRVQTLEEAQQTIAQQLNNCGSGVVLYFDVPEEVDYVGFVEQYALANPRTVMELPEVTVKRYPQEGQQQIVELTFAYKTSQAELRSLQNRVAPVFYSALQYVTGNWSEAEKTLRLYTFLMNRYEYNIQPTVTPAYSLLLEGVGDCRAFAMVYGAMCTQAGIDCRVVVGTRNGKSWVWNAVKLDGKYYYLDILRCNQTGVFALYEADKMTDYVWNTAAYTT